MRKIYFLLLLLLCNSTFTFGQFQGCGNRINTVTFTPITGTNDLTVTINSSCCQVHNLENHNYVNTSPNHNLTLCYRDTGLLMQTTIDADVILPNANAAGTQNFTINSFVFGGGLPGDCSTNMVFHPAMTLSFTGPLTVPRVFTLANDAFETVKFSLYPNPNSGEFSIDLPQSIDSAQIAVFDVSGKQVYTDASYHSGNLIGLKNLSGGLYFAKVMSEQSTQVLKFVIK